MRRTRAEFGRHVLRAGTFGLVAGTTAGSAVAVLLAGADGELALLLPFVFFVLPLAGAPFMAYRVSQDRESGMATLHAIAPLKRTEPFLASAMGGVALVTLIVITFMPLFLVVTGQSAIHARNQLAPFLLWAAVLGLSSAFMGLIIGYAVPGRPAAAVSAAFGVLLAWIGLATQGHALMEAASGAVARQVVRTVIHWSPLTWAGDAIEDGSASFGEMNAAALTAASSLGLVFLIGAAVVALVATAGGRGSRRTRVALAGFLLALLFAAGTAVAWAVRPVGDADSPFAEERKEAFVSDWWIRGAVSGQDTPFLRGSVEMPATLRLDFAGPPNKTIVITHLGMDAPDLVIASEAGFPRAVRLERLVRDTEGLLRPGQMIGVATVEIPIHLAARTTEEHHILAVVLDADGAQTALNLPVRLWGWDIRPALASLTSVLVASIAGVAAVWVPRGLNRW